LNGQRLRDPIPLSAGDADIPEESSLLHVRGRILGTISSTGLGEDCLVGPMDSSKFDSMPVTLSGMSSPTVSRKRRWWVFRPEYELGQIFDEALARLPNLDPLWTMHLELFLITVAAKFHNESLAFVPARWLLVENLLAGDRFQGFRTVLGPVRVPFGV